MASQLRDDGLSQDEAQPYMLEFQHAVDVVNEPYTKTEALASLQSAYGGESREPARKMDDDVGRSSSSSSSSPSDSDSDSSSHSHSSSMESIRRCAQEADRVEAEAVCLGDKRRWPGTPLYTRRQAQYPVFHNLWAVLFPDDTLPTAQINAWLTRYDPGDECEQAVDNIIVAHELNQRLGKGPIKSPKKYMTDAMLKSLDPDHGVKRVALKHQRAEDDSKEDELFMLPS